MTVKEVNLRDARRESLKVIGQPIEATKDPSAPQRALRNKIEDRDELVAWSCGPLAKVHRIYGSGGHRHESITNWHPYFPLLTDIECRRRHDVLGRKRA
jgi:hypothetical protein